MSFTIRPATRDDYDAVSAIAEEVHEMHATAVPAVFRHGEAPLPPDYYHYLVRGIAGAVYIAEHDAVIVGYLVLETERPHERDDSVRRRVTRVEQIGVTHSARGAGVGRALMETAINWAETHHADAISLLVWEFNQEAIAFYEHLGLHTESRTMTLSLP